MRTSFVPVVATPRAFASATSSAFFIRFRVFKSGNGGSSALAAAAAACSCSSFAAAAAASSRMWLFCCYAQPTNDSLPRSVCKYPRFALRVPDMTQSTSQL